MLVVTDQDAAERHKRYWATTVKKPDKVTSKDFIERMVYANDVVKYMPCLRHKEGCPTTWETGNVPETEIRMCTHVLNALPQTIREGYHASHGTHFPVCLTNLGEDLTFIEANVACAK